MIFAELHYAQDYAEIHHELVEYLQPNYPELESGLQGDSWIWVYDGTEKVAIDTFSSMKHQIKSDSSSGNLAQRVIMELGKKYELSVFDVPEPEPHED